MRQATPQRGRRRFSRRTGGQANRYFEFSPCKQRISLGNSSQGEAERAAVNNLLTLQRAATQRLSDNF